MCQSQVAMKKRYRNSESHNVETVIKRAKQIALDDEASHTPSSPVDIATDFEEAGATSDSSVDLEDALAFEEIVVPTKNLNLEVKLMQGAVNEMQATVNLASARINELRDLLKQYAESR